MILRAVLLLLAFLATPAALAQPVPMLGLAGPELCQSRGDGETLADIDAASCRPFRNLGEVDSQNQVIWVRGRIEVPKAYRGLTPLGFHTGALAAREIWWNGERIGSVGRPGASREAETPGNLDAVTWIPPHLIRKGENHVAIRYSTFHLAVRVKTPVHYAFAAPMSEMSVNMLTSYGPGLAVTGALVAAALFFGFAFLTDRRGLGSLFICLMSLCAVGQLWLETIRGFTDFPYPLQIWRLTGIGVLALGFALAMTAYVAGRFAPRRWPIYVALAAISALALWPFMPGFDGMTLGFILAPTVVALAAAAQGIAAKRSGAMLSALALSVFLAFQLIETAGFLNRTFFFAVSLLALALMVDQVRALRRAREAEEHANRRAAMLELELLRRRIAPHFLMNTLNALSEWVESDPKTGVKMIEALAEEFRLLSQISDRPLIPLSEEIALCRRHVDVMSYRVDRPFSLTVKNVEETAEVPPGVLHTLVENAFTHSRFETGGEFVLTSERIDGADRLVLLTPPAASSREPRPSAGGEGLAYVRRRLEAAFGAGASVESGAWAMSWRTILTIPRSRLAAGPAA